MSDTDSIVSAMQAAAEADTGEGETTEEKSSEGEPQTGGEAVPNAGADAGPDLGAAALAEARSRAAREAEARLQREAEEELEQKRSQVEERESRLQALAKNGDVVEILQELGFDAVDRKAIAEMMYIQEMGDAAPAELKNRLGDIKERSKLQKLEAEVERLRQERTQEAESAKEAELVEAYHSEIFDTLEEKKASYEFVDYLHSQDATTCQEQLAAVAERLFEVNGAVAEPEEVLEAANGIMKHTLAKWEGFFQRAQTGDGQSKGKQTDSQVSTITGSMTGAAPMSKEVPEGLEEGEHPPDVMSAIAAMKKAAAERSG